MPPERPQADRPVAYRVSAAVPAVAGRTCLIAALARTPGRDDAIEDRHVAAVEAVDPRVHVVRVTARDRWLDEAPDAEVILGFRPLRDGAVQARHLKWVHSIGAGVENLCQDVLGTGIVVTNSHVHGDVIAEHVWALVLAHARRLPAALAGQTARRWLRDGVIGTVVRDRTLGVLGLGTIGREVARRAAAFGMRVVGTKRTPAPVEGVAQVLPPDRIDEVLRAADVLAITLPFTGETRGTVGARELALLPRGAFVVNVGRGGLVDEQALAEAIRAGRLSGAGLDVFETEPLPEGSPLWTLPGVIVTPHVGGAFAGFLDRAVPFFCENLRKYLSGEPLQNVVDPARGY